MLLDQRQCPANASGLSSATLLLHARQMFLYHRILRSRCTCRERCKRSGGRPGRFGSSLRKALLPALFGALLLLRGSASSREGLNASGQPDGTEILAGTSSKAVPNNGKASHVFGSRGRPSGLAPSKHSRRSLHLPVLGPESVCEDVNAWIPPDATSPLVLQLVNEGYLRMQVNFLIHMRENSTLSYANLFLLCIDEESVRAMDFVFGIPCARVFGVVPTKKDKVLRLRRNHQIWNFRAKVLACLLDAGRDVLMSDNDALWLRDPLPDLRDVPGDALFQRGRWPSEFSDPRYGVTMCMGFALFRSGGAGMPMFVRVIRRLIAAIGDDQFGVNMAANRLNITWDYSDQSDMRLYDSTRLGSAHLQGIPDKFQVTFLPHSKYTRDCAATPISGETIIAHCFPRTNREEAMKNASLWVLDAV